MCDVLSFPPSCAKQNMERDHRLLQEVETFKKPLLHLYRWKKLSFTFGYFCRPQDHLHQKALEKWDIDSARRSTGGGICFHFTDYAFSFLLPASHPDFSPDPLQNYLYVNRRVQKALCQYMSIETQLITASQAVLPHQETFCSAKATKYDVLFQGKKVGGAAQRQTKGGFLHQGSLFLQSMPWEILNEILKGGSELISHIKSTSHFLKSTETPVELERSRLEQCLIDQFQ